MNTSIYIIDAFASKPFSGNPAGVCLLNEWLPENVMQNIAMENNQAETAFVIPSKEDFHIRWFTPTVEVDLCGHATLASAFAMFNFTDYKRNEILFQSRSGILKVRRDGELLALNFPTDNFVTSSLGSSILESIGKTDEIYKGKTDYMVVLKSQRDVEMIDPDFAAITKADARGVIVTAPGDDCDFVSRFFAPQSGVNEDPVTGSAHTTLTPFWSKRLNKKEMKARQISKRGGELFVKDLGDRTEIAGKARLYLKGEIAF
jgi:PhzF family phenazine biosynthesis protein